MRMQKKASAEGKEWLVKVFRGLALYMRMCIMKDLIVRKRIEQGKRQAGAGRCRQVQAGDRQVLAGRVKKIVH